MESCDAEALQIGLSEVGPLDEGLVNDANHHVECLRHHFELVVQLREPVHQVLTVLGRNFTLKVRLEEVLRVHVPLLLSLHVHDDLGHKLNDTLRISDL